MLKREVKRCKTSRVTSNSCGDAVDQIRTGTWKAGTATNYKVCKGAEIDATAALANFKSCEIIEGNLDVYISKDFSLKDVADNFVKLLAVSGNVAFFDSGVDDFGSEVSQHQCRLEHADPCTHPLSHTRTHRQTHAPTYAHTRARTHTHIHTTTNTTTT